MENPIAENYKHIKGWGIDANPNNNPTYPMKKTTGADHDRLNYERPPLQPVNVEILHSNERPNITAVFGTSTPPSGLSGSIRRYAFRYSENSLAHWMPLVLADRIGIVEGLVSDFRSGHIPNIFAEGGWKAQWKYDRTAVVKKVVMFAAVTTAIILLAKRKRSNKD
jgi:hypothetical protein